MSNLWAGSLAHSLEPSATRPKNFFAPVRRREESTYMAEETKPVAQATKIPESDLKDGIRVNVNRILDAQKKAGLTPAWGVKEHNALLRLLAVDCGMSKEDAKSFEQHLFVAGTGGNAAQFRQSEFLKDRLPKAETRLSEYDSL